MNKIKKMLFIATATIFTAHASFATTTSFFLRVINKTGIPGELSVTSQDSTGGTATYGPTIDGTGAIQWLYKAPKETNYIFLNSTIGNKMAYMCYTNNGRLEFNVSKYKGDDVIITLEKQTGMGNLTCTCSGSACA